MVSQLQHQRQTFRCPVSSLTLLSWAWSVSPPIPETAKMPELGITRFVFSKAEFSSPFLLMEACAFLLGFLSTPPPALPRAHNPHSPLCGRLTLSSEGVAFGQSKALSGRPQVSITPKLASRVLQTHRVTEHSPGPCPNLSQVQATDEVRDHPRTRPRALAAAPVPSRRMAQRGHCASLGLRRALPPHCCCCHERLAEKCLH